MTFEGLGERLVAVNGIYGVVQRLVYGMVARAVEGNHLLDAHGNPFFDLEGQHLVDVIIHLVDAAVHADHLVLPIDPGTGGLGEMYV